MREIKFRAWDEGHKKMLYSEIELLEAGLYKKPQLAKVEHIFIGFNLNDPTYNWMQYTGLKDSKGVEIYEGDILDWLGCGVVTYEIDTFWAVTPRGSHYHIDERSLVIGNIYENPELLEEKVK